MRFDNGCGRLLCSKLSVRVKSFTYHLKCVTVPGRYRLYVASNRLSTRKGHLLLVIRNITKSDIASDIRGDFAALPDFYWTLIKLYSTDGIALNEFVKNVVVDSQINNVNALLSNFVSLTLTALWLFEFNI